MTNESRFVGNAHQDNVMKPAVNVLCLAKHKLHETLKELASRGQINYKLLESAHKIANFFYNSTFSEKLNNFL